MVLPVKKVDVGVMVLHDRRRLVELITGGPQPRYACGALSPCSPSPGNLLRRQVRLCHPTPAHRRRAVYAWLTQRRALPSAQRLHARCAAANACSSVINAKKDRQALYCGCLHPPTKYHFPTPKPFKRPSQTCLHQRAEVFQPLRTRLSLSVSADVRKVEDERARTDA